jgi:GTP-binding protein
VAAGQDGGVSRPLPLRFLTSADDLSRLPDSRGELAVVGRSNVGKSSLLNALAHRKDLAKVSKTPGRTRLLNCFGLEDGTTLVDLPGYGYANAPAQVRGSWARMIEGYLVGREQLRRVLVLVDGEVGPTALDVQMLEWLDDNELVWSVVATKHDKVKASRRDRRKRDLAAGCGVTPSEVVWVSASTGTGIDRLRGLVHDWLHT